jgi:type II secretory pathway pseudopilin PulG
MVAIIVASIVCLSAGPYLYRLYRRERLRMAAQEVSTMVLAARLASLKNNQQIVLWIDPSNHVATGWADRPPYNFLQDPEEKTLLQFRIRSGVYLRYSPGNDGVNGPNAVSFDGYEGNRELGDRIVFHPDGTLFPPQNANSKPPSRPASVTARVPFGSIDCNPDNSCRGVYISDRPDGGKDDKRNTFRISVNDFGPTGRVTILKWLPESEGGNPGETNYVPPPWKWAD